MAAEPYREIVRWPAWVHLVVWICIGAAGGSAVGAVRRAGLGPGVLLACVVAAVIAYVWWRMRHVALEFGPEGAAFGFGGLGTRVPAARITGAWPEDYRLSRYMGWGWRIGTQPGDRAYSVIGCSRGVRLEFVNERGKRYSVFLASRDPERAVTALPESVRKSSPGTAPAAT